MPTLISPSFKIESTFDGAAVLREIELYARNCYKSEARMTAESSVAFINMLLRQVPPHEGILDHHVITVRLVIDRGISHEVVRHRIAAYLQESTRYCDYGKAGQINVIDIAAHMTEEQYAEWWEAMCDAERHYNKLRAMGCKPEIARSVLPNSLKTEVIMTLNLTSWRNFFKKRAASLRAHPQMREVAAPLLTEFKRLLPVVFDDICLPEAA